MVAASILPVAWHNGEWRVLFGKECSLETSAKGWSDFGGRVDDFDASEPKRRAAFRILESAAREGMEETTAFLGDARHILERLVEYGMRFSADASADKLFAPLDRDQADWTPPEIAVDAVDAAAKNKDDVAATQQLSTMAQRSGSGSSERSKSQKRKRSSGRSNRSGTKRRRYRTPTPAAAPFTSSSPEEAADEGSSVTESLGSSSKSRGGNPGGDPGDSVTKTTDLSDVWRSVWDDPASPDPTRDWDCLEKSGYHVFFYPVDYDENLVRAFNANHALIWARLDRKMLQKTKLFEKAEMRWFTLEDMKRERSIFRKFYQPIADAIRKRLESRAGPE